MNATVIIIVKTIIILGIFFVLATMSKKIITKMGDKRINESEKKYKTYDRIDIIYSQIAYICFYFILFIGLMIVLPMYGIQKETIYGMLISVSIAIGFSAQGPLSNIWCGLIMILCKVYEVNDVVTLNIQSLDGKEVTGRIVAINLFYTKLADVKDGREIIIGNNIVYSTAVSYNESVIYN
jgi:small-conductance mechanosensitive channel